ncbi:hypothetical protein [Eubacterium ventriosum]|jgi:hypothetical protein|nr:hypothetical protein [Eubacterium ventriosum]
MIDLLSTTMMSSIATLNIAANTIKLSNVGIDTPFCHLYHHKHIS